MTFKNIYSNYHNEIQNLVTKKIGVANKELAEELTNDVFLRVNKHLKNFDSEKSSIRTWLYNITQNIVIDHWRKKSLEVMSYNKEDHEGNEFVQISSPSLSPQEQIINTELSEKILSAIDSLSDTYRNLAKRFFIREQSYNEIINETGMSEGTVKGKLYRVREKLQEKLS